MNGTNTTAAQPLDLDKLEALARAATPGPWKRSNRPNGPFWHISSEYTIGGEPCKSGRQSIGAIHAENKRGAPKYAAMFEANANFVAEFNPATALALIAQARAAHPAESIDQPIGHLSPAIGQPDAAICQPQGATCTTGASELPRWIDDQKGKDPLMDDMIAYIIDLRAQLAAKGQGDDYTVGDSELAGKIMTFLGLATTQSMEPGADPLRDRLAAKIALWRPAAPASAQPADELDHGETVLRVQEALGITRTGWVSPDVIMLRIEQLQKASAQPDRGAAAPVYAVGASASIDGIADELEAEALNYEGDFADTVKGCVEALREIAASPASQPAAPEAAHADAANAGGLLPCAFCGDGEPVLMPNEGPQGIGRSIGHPHTDTHYVHCDNCGADGPAHLTEYEARSAWNSRNSHSPATSATPTMGTFQVRVNAENLNSGARKFTVRVAPAIATSAADAKDASGRTQMDIWNAEAKALDAERAGWEAAAKALSERAEGRYRNGDYTEADECRQCASMLHDMKPARAAMAAAPSSAAGTEGGNHG